MADGTDFAGYTIVRCLGSGGMGEVYVAAHPRLPRQDALKILRPEVSTDSEFRERFLREADLAAELTHAHIVGVYDRGEFNGQLWISMQYIDGTDVSRLVRGGNRVSDDETAEIIAAVADALDYAHERNLLHRDVKPANILISEADPGRKRIKLADFGIARRADDSAGLTATNMTVGTVSYAAPEQLTGSTIDGRADQYALAATAFHLLTGAPPFENSNPAVVIGQHLTAAPPSVSERRPDLAALDPVFAKALAKDPKDRFDQCTDFARALQHGLGMAGSDATTLAPVAQFGATEVLRPAKAPRSRRSLILPVVLTVLLIAALVFAAVEFTRAKDEEPQRPASTSTSATTTPPTTTTPTTTAASPSPETTMAPASTEAPVAPSPTEATVTSTVTVDTPTPTTTTPTTTETPAPEQETPIRECMEQTGMTRLQCWEQIRRSERRR